MENQNYQNIGMKFLNGINTDYFNGNLLSLFGNILPTFITPIPPRDKKLFKDNFDNKFSGKKPKSVFNLNKDSFNKIVGDIFSSNISLNPKKIISYLHIFFYDENYFDNNNHELNLLFRFSDKEYFFINIDDIEDEPLYQLEHDGNLKKIDAIKFSDLMSNFVKTGNAGDDIKSQTKPNSNHDITRYITYDFGSILKHNAFWKFDKLEFELMLISNKLSFQHGRYYSDNNDRLSLALSLSSTNKSYNEEYFDFGDLNP